MEHPFDHREHQPMGCVSVSIGAACFPSHAHDKASLIATADAMLYQAKRTGRGRVCAPADLMAPGGAGADRE
jgi:diguanylate cyclase (GGDEF)-like protein